MKIKVEKDKIVQAVRKLESIEIVLENEKDAKEALDLILIRSEIFDEGGTIRLKDVNVTAVQEYSDSAVAYKVMFLIEFVFEEDVPLVERVAMIKALQKFFEKI